MMPIRREEIEVLLDTPDRTDYVVSAYADLTVQNGFERYADLHLKNEARAAASALAGAEAKVRRSLAENVDVIRQALQSETDPRARGAAVFSSVARGLRQVVLLDFPVENRLVIDEEPFLLPLLEHWFGDRTYLIALADSDEAHLFEARRGQPDKVRDLTRGDVHDDIQRDKPRFSFKKRFARTQHERLFGMEDDKFLKEVAEAVRDHWQGQRYAGLILLGQPQITGPLRRLLSRETASAVVAEAPHAMTTEPDDLTAAVAPMIERVQAEREEGRLAEFRERAGQKHLVAAGATEVLDALQQGRATEILLGARAEIPGARCENCNYRLGAPVQICPYCGGTTRLVDAVQDLLRLAMRHGVPVTLVHRPTSLSGPLGEVAALLRAEANWAPSPDAAAASEGHHAPPAAPRVTSP